MACQQRKTNVEGGLVAYVDEEEIGDARIQEGLERCKTIMLQ